MLTWSYAASILWSFGLVILCLLNNFNLINDKFWIDPRVGLLLSHHSGTFSLLKLYYDNMFMKKLVPISGDIHLILVVYLPPRAWTELDKKYFLQGDSFEYCQEEMVIADCTDTLHFWPHVDKAKMCLRCGRIFENLKK